MKEPKELNRRGKPRKRAAPPSAFKPGNKFAFKPKHRDAANAAKAAIPPITDDTGQFSIDELARVVRFASLDKSQATIAYAIGLTSKAFAAALKSNEALEHAYEVGVGLSRDYHLGQLRKLGAKNFIPSIYAAKALHGLTDQSDAAPGVGAPAVQIVIAAASGGKVIEGTLITDGDDDDTPSLNVVEVAQPSPFNRPPSKHNGEQRPDLLPPAEHPTPAEPASPAEPALPPTARERDALRDFKHEVGLSTDRRSFDTEAAWRRFDKTR